MTLKKALLPLAILAAAIAVAVFIVKLKPEPKRKQPETVSPPMEVILVPPQEVLLKVRSQGTVRPRTQTTLTAEVSGRIVEVSPHFKPGGFFQKGDTLLQIDDADLRAAQALEQANLAQAEYNLAQEEALSEQARIDWEDLGEGEPTPLALREPQIKQSQAALASARARVEKATRDLERSTVKAPYDCLVEEKFVDLGGYVTGNPGTQLTTLFATDTAEVRLPLSIEQMALIDLPLAYRGEETSLGPEVTLSTTQAGQTYTWQGRIVRMEATVDDRSRLVYVVAAVDNPYGRDPEYPQRPPLRSGLFVEAEIQGRRLPEAFVIPRYALREGETVLIVDANNTLQRKKVKVVQATSAIAIITDGLQDGDRVITSPVEYAINGMSVTPVDSQDSSVEGQVSREVSNARGGAQ